VTRDDLDHTIRTGQAVIDERRAQIRSLLADRDRAIADLHYLYGLTAGAIAREYAGLEGLSLSNVRLIINLHRPPW
jgi:hypothetical protein